MEAECDVNMNVEKCDTMCDIGSEAIENVKGTVKVESGSEVADTSETPNENVESEVATAVQKGQDAVEKGEETTRDEHEDKKKPGTQESSGAGEKAVADPVAVTPSQTTDNETPEQRLSLRDEEMVQVGAEVLFPKATSEFAYSGWDNLRW